MVTSLHELTKQLDALTYNSRSVLNALIRSVLSAGSSDGYEVVRGGETIRMTRVDIYHLYTLYQEWNARIGRNGSTVDDEGVVSFGLPELVAELDADYQSENGDTSATPYRDAVVKHSKILYMNSDNLDNTDEDWILLVDRSSNPKMVTNSAPIPINIRTPIYDENLSTKHFSEYETYLFPRGYYMLDAMGSYGDGMTHNAGGHKWLFDIDGVFQVKSPLSIFGVQNNEFIDRLPSDYGHDKSYSLVVGDNCFVYGQDSFVSGRWNQTIGSDDAIVGGRSNHIYADDSGIIGGIDCNVLMPASTAGGSSSVAGGDSSFAYGYGSSVGGHPYPFYMSVNVNDGVIVEPNTTCQDTIEVDGCTYIRSASSNTSSNVNDGTSRDVGPNEIYIRREDVKYSGIDVNHISSGDNNVLSYLDFKVGDVVSLYRLHSESGSNTVFPISEVIKATVTAITPNISISNGRSQLYGYIVTLNKPVTTTHGISATRGYVVRQLAYDFIPINEDGNALSKINLTSAYSASVGLRTIAAGNGQVVVGAQNKELLRPNFIVGIGDTSYIKAADRCNGLVVAPYYNYMTVREQKIVSGMSTFTTAKSKYHGMEQDYVVDFATRQDEDGLDKYRGYYAYSDNKTDADKRRALLRVFTNYSCLLVGDAGIEVFTPTETGVSESGLYEGFISTCISGGGNGAVVISDTSGGNLINWVDIADQFYLKKSTDKQSVMIIGDDQAVLSAYSLTLVQGKHVQLVGDKLQFSFEAETYKDHATYGALVAYPAAVINNPSGINYYDQRLNKLIAYYGNELGAGWNTCREVGTGFYYSGNDRIPTLATRYGNLAASYHTINSTWMFDTVAGVSQYSVAQLVLPGYVETGAAQHGHGSQLAHPVFVSSVVSTSDPNGYSNNASSLEAGQNYICEELAYMSDLAELENEIYHVSSKTIYDMVRPAAATLATASTEYVDTVRKNGKSYVSNAGYFKSFIPEGFVYPNSTRVSNAFIDSLVDTDLYYADKFLTLNAVALNPASIMRFGDVGSELSFAPLAFSPMQIAATSTAEQAIMAVDSERTRLTYLTDNYETKARETTPGQELNYGLSSTPFGSMVSYSNQELNNKAAAIWIAMYNNHSRRMEWVRIIENLIVVLHNGHLTVEFDLYPRANEPDYELPTYANMSAVNPGLDKKYLNSSSNMDYNNMTFNIPLSPDVAGKLDHLVNPSTGVAVQLHGRASYTGDSNSYVSATIVPGFTVNWTGLQTKFNYPSIQITISGLDLTVGAKYHYEVQGDVAYVN